MELDFQLGTVLSADPYAKDATGNTVPSISVRCHLDSSTLTMPMSSAAWGQVQPIAGYKVLFFRFGPQYARPIMFWGNDEDFMRKGAAGLNPGDVVVQSPVGYGYLRLADDGSVQLVGGDMASLVSFLTDGTLQVQAPVLKLMTYANALISIDDAGVISMVRTDNDGNVTDSIVLDASHNAAITVQGDISLKAENIYLDGKIFMGAGATVPATAAQFGEVVTSGPTGTYPADFVSGTPIPGSQTIKAAS
jgi:hypothetical protein